MYHGYRQERESQYRHLIESLTPIDGQVLVAHLIPGIDELQDGRLPDDGPTDPPRRVQPRSGGESNDDQCCARGYRQNDGTGQGAVRVSELVPEDTPEYQSCATGEN
jgi:hypothetical protein